MSNFTSLREGGETWYSPPFYTHIGGYKLCLEIDANGSGSGKGTHVSVFVCLMRGEYDDSLPWPFRADVTVQIMNHRSNEGHVERTVHFDESIPDVHTGRVTEGERAPAWGYDKFIPHSALCYDETWNTEFLTSKDDSLEFQVRVSKTAEGLPAVAPDQPSSDATSAEQPELPPIPPVDIVMSNFISYKIGGDSWCSPAFYSHTGGYKMCLRVDANVEV